MPVPDVTAVPDESSAGSASAEGVQAAGDAQLWERLLGAAREAATHAYAPYSRFDVGAAALVDDGRLVVGCNVENASYGVGLCAECGLVSALQASGGGRLTYVACVGGPAADVVMPCGRCRQLLWEHGGAELQVLTPDGPLPMTAVLPQAFGPDDLDRAALYRQP